MFQRRAIGRGLGPIARILVGTGLLTVAGAARAVEPGCAPAFRIEGLSPSWVSALDGVRRDLATRLDVDRCADVAVAADDAGARVTVTLADGRTATRRIETPADLRAAVTALLLLPLAPAPDASDVPVPTPLSDEAAPVAPMEPPRAPVTDRRPPIPGSERARSPPAEPSTARLMLAIAGGARWSGGYPGASVGALADVSLGPWLVGVNGHFAGYEGPGPSTDSVGYTMTTMEVGAEIGFRVHAGPIAVSAVVGPSIAAVSQDLRSTPPAVPVAGSGPKSAFVPAGRNGRVGRLGATLRATLFPSMRVRPFLGLDASFDVMTDPANQTALVDAGTGALPTWSAGLSLGAEMMVWP